jgi:hypothetical protein
VSYKLGDVSGHPEEKDKEKEKESARARTNFERKI